MTRAELEAEQREIEQRRSDRAKMIARENQDDDADYFREIEIDMLLDPSKRVPLCIVLSNMNCRERCAICKSQFDGESGPALTIWGTVYKMVCDDCGERHDPELMIAVKAYRDLPFDPHGNGRIFIGSPADAGTF